MKLDQEQKKVLGIAAVCTSAVVSQALLVHAVRRRSAASAFLALAAAAGGAVGATFLLNAAVTPDSDGENVVMPDQAEDNEVELFDDDGADAADLAIDNVL